jgi:protein-S-isoprenylcysteine O-methyltransferase Ste14
VRIYVQKPTAHFVKLIALLCLYGVMYFPGLVGLTAPVPPPGALPGSIGLLLCLAGLALLLLARFTLGRNWSDLVVIKKDHELVARGPYRWVRHPLYSGFLLAFAGSALTLGSPAAYALLLFCILAFTIKARAEEKLLTRQFPSEYPAYCRRVKAFIPSLL